MIGGGAKRVWQTMHTPAPHLTGPPGKGALFSEHLERNPSTSCRMGSSRRKVIWALCSLLLLLEASSAKNVWKRALHARLAEKPHAAEADSPRQPRADRCPPPPRSLPPGACEAEPCQADSQCRQRQRCCYNGCAYACLEAMPPPPVVDWLVEPKPRWLGGNGWLLDGPEEVLQAETCSTTEDGAEPLLCPSGYECHILSPGDMAKGIPNRGQCIKQGPAATSRPQISRETDEMMPAVDGVPQRHCLYALSQACRRSITRRQGQVCLECRLRATEMGSNPTAFFPGDLGQEPNIS
ncbi:WAP four-disulfide core domain protein 1 isoform X1 [Myotis daubentonii]|uniref:WAP four-disulfide core domain protein 1 isoform X1 n=1 Tax=Myotis daubentonii TaxID=98922 RepID=UPI002873D578|nr:WAP four-disulfide core domain protein 1 isoform X1 [Myotis daubentonii]